MRIIARDSRRSERLGEDFLKVADGAGPRALVPR